jgi:hypothetical protein
MSLAPDLKKISVEVSKLLLDPNNPRLFSKEEARVPLDKVMDPGVQDSTLKRLFPKNGKDQFKIDELVRSIRANRYVPEAGGYIFVRKLADLDYYIVLEGNRRLVALRELLDKADDLERESPEVLTSIRSIDALEIIDDIPEEQLQEKISYLLGTCHHGSHKNWSPFARAKGIYERYLQISGQDDESFSYKKKPYGEDVASLLSIEEKEVAERLQVYKAMSQLAKDPRMQDRRNGGIIDRYYSLVLGAIKTSSKKLRNYIPRDPNTLLLLPEAIDRMINLCNFDGTRDRKSAREEGGKEHPPAMINPKQWRFLAKILEDPLEAERDANLELVEIHQQPPEEVWARRHAALTKLTWSKWLEQVLGILIPVNMGTDFADKGARGCIESLSDVTEQLEAKGATD